MLGRRVMVVGTTGSGKSTLAARLAARLGVPHVELDALRHGPGWTEVHDAVFRPLVVAAVAADGWVVDGNYDSVRDLELPRATDVLWLDYRRRVVMRRMMKRSIMRAVTGGNCGTATARTPPRTPEYIAGEIRRPCTRDVGCVSC